MDDNLTDFPVYLDLSDLSSDFWSNVEGSGDLRITQTDGHREVPFEVVSFTDSGTSGTGEVHFKADLAHASDSVFWIYYGIPRQPYYHSQ